GRPLRRPARLTAHRRARAPTRDPHAEGSRVHDGQRTPKPRLRHRTERGPERARDALARDPGSRWDRAPSRNGGRRPGAGRERCPGARTLGVGARRKRSRNVQRGMVGLGRMGANIVKRLMRKGHSCVVYDANGAAVEALEKEGATGARTLEEFVAKLEKPRAAWVMVPAGVTEAVVKDLASRMERDDVIIDGGNSYFRD